MLTDDEIEYWFTANGNHIPVKKGQSKEQALSEFLKNKGDVQGYNADELSQKIRTVKTKPPIIEIDSEQKESNFNNDKESLKISLRTNKEYIDITPKQVFDLMKRLKSFIGREQATYDYQTGKKVELKDGYMVSFHQNEPNESGHYKSHFGRYSEEEYDRLANKFVEENDAEIYIGTYDEDPEISFKVKDKKQAIKLMIDYNQDAIWDNQNGKLIKNKNRDKSKNPMKEE